VPQCRRNANQIKGGVYCRVEGNPRCSCVRFDEGITTLKQSVKRVVAKRPCLSCIRGSAIAGATLRRDSCAASNDVHPGCVV